MTLEELKQITSILGLQKALELAKEEFVAVEGNWALNLFRQLSNLRLQ